jgi:4-aminobutyrate aminotransferase-like enzyme
VGAAYAMLDKPDPISAAAQIVYGYHQVFPLTPEELELLYSLIQARLCISVTNSAYQQEVEPDNEYLVISERPAWALLERLEQINPEFAHCAFRSACRLPASPRTPSVIQWLEKHSDGIGRVVEPDLSTERVAVFDLSFGSRELKSLIELSDTEIFTRNLFGRLQAVGARVGVGRYNEARPIYTSDLFKTDGNDGVQWRTVHLGLDLFMEAGSPVFAPLDGEVHSFRDNAGALDYGPTIILEHKIANENLTFFTLYGHLSKESLDGLKEGMEVERGAQIARIGDSRVNGGWPPHLHFQIIVDILGSAGEFPGVALASQRNIWLDLSPDPNLIARIPPALLRSRSMSVEEILDARSRHLSPSLSISYKEPLKIVRGAAQYLYDEDGRAYLDAVNNVAHVGHCHPRVVAAGQEQMAVLNTNTRYLHENLSRYAERLRATLPEPLHVCFFVCSGSEANELALRLARAHTGNAETIVIDAGYHGNTTGLIEISPYKFDGSGGAGAPSHVHKVPMPDSYRGPHKTSDSSASDKYASHVAAAVEQIRKHGRVPAFICESLPGCGGQIIPPDGYLREAYRHVRGAGGVCIADEVQVGFGRVGTHFWAFETQGVLPDIVTLGKPIGNGHPLGAVVTTPEIAASFANGMEYFNTFGGNPVSCAIGLAVLDVIEEERLQENALRVGTRLMQGLRELMARYPLIGDVRGLGLFVGVELVLDRDTLEPAPAQADHLVDRMKERGILVSTDGPFHNVIKIKPPLVFTEANADLLVTTMDKILKEDFFDA